MTEPWETAGGVAEPEPEADEAARSEAAGTDTAEEEDESWELVSSDSSDG